MILPPFSPRLSDLGRACVVDASVGVKWVIHEEDSDFAETLSDDYDRLIVPDRFYSEVCNVLWKRTKTSDVFERISAEEARHAMVVILSFPLVVVPAAGLARESLEIAWEIDHPTYDCDYLTLALREGVRVVTADRRLFRKAVSNARLRPFIQWIHPDGPR